MPVTLNDVHSRLNPTRMAERHAPANESEVVELVRSAHKRGQALIPAGGLHAMGGQQFRTDGVLLDTRRLNEVIGFDSENGLLRMGAGATWPEVISAGRERDPANQWAIRQKQTGADELTLGGSVAVNAHGRVLGKGPIVEDVEAVTVIAADGQIHACSREHNCALFELAVGGYGLFGVITEVTLRLGPRYKMRRIADIIEIDDAINAAYRRFDQGCLYGDFQYAIDTADQDFLRRGVMAAYRPVASDCAVSEGDSDLPRESWMALLRLTLEDKREAFQRYAEHYLRTHGNVYWSDTMQLSTYIPDYAEMMATALGQDEIRESLMITELYVLPARLPSFMERARSVLLSTGVEDIYGTIGSIRPDETTFLPWAQQHYACVIFNLRTEHSEAGVERTRGAARSLIDAAAELDGSFFLTYHPWASREQIEQCHPRIHLWLQRKREYDPHEVFQSDWYCRLRSMFDV